MNEQDNNERTPELQKRVFPLVPESFADVVVGGQAGSEGKGALVEHLLRVGDYGATVRPGSSNAGHTVYADTGRTNAPDSESGWHEVIHQVIPSAATVTDDVVCYMAAESSFSLDEFEAEAERMDDLWGDGAAMERVVVDPKAAIITDEHVDEEAERTLGADIGSTVHGCGAVRADKVWRSAGGLRLAEDYTELSAFFSGERVSKSLANHGRQKENVLVEGTQGTLLSMNQSDYWPYTTSRDCTATALMSSCGLPPAATRHVWAVFRTYPIRVGGTSGDMSGEEIDFETVADRAGFDEPPVEYTSVTNKKRRIFEWSWDDYEQAMLLNNPDYVALTFLDYLDADNYGASAWWDLTRDTRQWVANLHETSLLAANAPVAFLKTGPEPDHGIDLRVRRQDALVYAGIPPVDFDPAQDMPHGRPDDDWGSTHPRAGVEYALGGEPPQARL